MHRSLVLLQFMTDWCSSQARDTDFAELKVNSNYIGLYGPTKSTCSKVLLRTPDCCPSKCGHNALVLQNK